MDFKIGLSIGPSIFGKENGLPIFTLMVPVGLTTLKTLPMCSVPVIPIGKIVASDIWTNLATPDLAFIIEPLLLVPSGNIEMT